MNEVVVSSLLCNILIVCVCVVMIAWAAVGIQALINDRKEEKRRVADEKRKENSEARDLEYHQKRMENLTK